MTVSARAWSVLAAALVAGCAAQPVAGDAGGPPADAAPACNLARNDCPAGQTCDVVCAQGASRTLCRTVATDGGVPNGGRCTATAECAAGTACFATSRAEFTCVRYCDTDADCPTGICRTRQVFRNCGQNETFMLKFCLP